MRKSRVKELKRKLIVDAREKGIKLNDKSTKHYLRQLKKADNKNQLDF